MSRKRFKMMCPECDIPMNHHATKIVHPVDERSRALVDKELGGIPLQRYSCPECGCEASHHGEVSHGNE